MTNLEPDSPAPDLPAVSESGQAVPGAGDAVTSAPAVTAEPAVPDAPAVPESGQTPPDAPVCGMEIDIVTLFPEAVDAMLGASILGRARKRGYIAIRTHQIRAYTTNKQMQVDDYPYGGGRGAVMQADPLYRCHAHVVEAHGPGRTIFLSPCGRTFTQEVAKELRERWTHLILVCGHYEGVDQRFLDECVDEEISVGDFVLTGGEIPAMAVADAVCRMVPGVLPDPECFQEESHWNGLLEYPQYSRPAVWHGRAVPEILLSGDHGRVAAWRKKESYKRTMARRPDLFARFDENSLTTKAERKILAEAKAEFAAEQSAKPAGVEAYPDPAEAERTADAGSEWEVSPDPAEAEPSKMDCNGGKSVVR